MHLTRKNGECLFYRWWGGVDSGFSYYGNALKVKKSNKEDFSSIGFDGMLKQGYISDYYGSKRLFRNLIRREELPITEILLKRYADIVPESQSIDFTELEYKW